MMPKPEEVKSFPLMVNSRVVGFAFVEDETDEGILVACVITKPLPAGVGNRPIADFSFTMINEDYES